MAALPQQRRVVDHQNRLVATNQPVDLSEQFRFQRCRIPNAGGDEMMQPIIRTRRKARRHRLNTLAITRADQSRNVERAHPLSHLVAKTSQEQFQPALEFLGQSNPSCALVGFTNANRLQTTQKPIRKSQKSHPQPFLLK